MTSAEWPALPYSEWLDSYETLHLYTQVIGKIQLALSPHLNEWWHVAIHPWARGLTTGIIPYDGRLFEIMFDFTSHQLSLFDSTRAIRVIDLADRTVANFYALVLSKLDDLNIAVTIDPKPQEIDIATPFPEDTSHFRYDEPAIERFWRVLSRIVGVFEQFRSGFSGKASPVHFWWGSFDLNLTRFSGNLCSAPPHAGRMARIDCDEEHFSAGFWPGNATFPQPAFYAYSYPALPGIEKQSVQPKSATWNPSMGEFILPYDAIRSLSDPGQAILEFLQSSYEAIATLGKWDQAILERNVA
ncbi:MAG TPA: DUF5996 family protein [Candidatus Kapabacteria bacterium]|jgi:hypothetical protein